jgi:hypothetical protein
MPQALKPLLMLSAVMEACHAVLNKVGNVHFERWFKEIFLKQCGTD